VSLERVLSIRETIASHVSSIRQTIIATRVESPHATTMTKADNPGKHTYITAVVRRLREVVKCLWSNTVNTINYGCGLDKITHAAHARCTHNAVAFIVIHIDIIIILYNII
jgi:hypothetical protein